MAIRNRGIGLDYEPINVETLFGQNEYYTVPRYQRGYSWGSEEIKELLSDLSDAHKSFPDEAYLLGQIIVCPSTQSLSTIANEINQWDLIDGQQRSTTLYLLVLRATTIVEKNKSSQQSQAEKRKSSARDIMRSIPDEINPDQIHPRIKVASNGDLFVMKLLEGESLDNAYGPTQTNIALAVSEIDAHFETLTTEEVEAFLTFVLNKVWLVRLALSNSAHALRVFQKVNNRGLELDDADLIKSFLFQKVTDEAFSDVSEKWESASNYLFKARLKRVKSMEFLMKVLVGIRTGISVPTGSLYTKWVELLATETDVKSLADGLPSHAKALVRISKNELPKNGQKTDLTLGTFMQSWIQQFEVLLAGQNLSEKSYDTLLRAVEDRAMLSFWAKEKSQQFEVIIHPWALEISKLDSLATSEDVLAACGEARKNFNDLSDRAFLGITNLSYQVTSHRDKIRYILARVNRSLQGMIHSTSYSMTDLMQTSKGDDIGYDLDHVFPKSPDCMTQWVQDFSKDEKFGGASRYEKSVHSIGNLILLHPEDNRSQSDALPWESEKLTNLSESELYLNRTLTKSDLWSGNKQGRLFETLIGIQNDFDTEISGWGEAEADKRAILYWHILQNDIKANLGITTNP